MRVELPEFLWYGDRTFPIDLPDEWDALLYPMRGADGGLAHPRLHYGARDSLRHDRPENDRTACPDRSERG
jgi:hypothetical protein